MKTIVSALELSAVSGGDDIVECTMSSDGMSMDCTWVPEPELEIWVDWSYYDAPSFDYWDVECWPRY